MVVSDRCCAARCLRFGRGQPDVGSGDASDHLGRQLPSANGSDIDRAPCSDGSAIDRAPCSDGGADHCRYHPADRAGNPIPIDGAVPLHGFAYSTATGVVIAGLDGSPRAHLAGYRVTDRSPETGRIAAVVTAADGTRYALVVGSATIAPIVSGAANESTSVYGWTVDDAHTGCLSDARRAGSTLRLCATSEERLPRSIRRVRADGTLEVVADSPKTAMPGTGHWADAIAAADGAVAATWSGDCESLTSFRVTPAQAVQQLVPGDSAVLGWDGVDILVARFGGCGPATPDDGVYRVTPTGATTRVPLIDATEAPVAW